MFSLQKRESLRKKGKKVGFTISSFTILHPGYIDMLFQAKKVCDYLVVGLMVNPKIERPEKEKQIFSVFERYMILSGIKYIDEIIPFETENDLLEFLKIYKPDIRIVGEDYKNNEDKITGKDIVKIYFNERKHNYSSRNFIKKIKEDK